MREIFKDIVNSDGFIFSMLFLFGFGALGIFVIIITLFIEWRLPINQELRVAFLCLLAMIPFIIGFIKLIKEL